MSYFACLTNNFDLEEPETYEKAMASDQAKKMGRSYKARNGLTYSTLD